jgi:hypothetical protein
MNSFIPQTGSEADWNAAYYRLEDYFRALRLTNKVHQSQMVIHILQSAAARHALTPEQNPTVLAMEEAQKATNRWFGAILGERERMAVVGLISFLAVDAPSRWPTTLLSENVPADLSLALRESDVRAGPDLQVSSMVPRAIDVGPLLDPIDVGKTLAKAGNSLGLIAAALVLVGVSVSLFIILK